MKPKTKEAISLIFKGMAMGAANVIPGVSGGTIAFITGIFERLIHAIKSFNLTALKLLLSGKFTSFLKHIDFAFLVYVFLGIGIAIISIAKLFEYLFENYPVYLWSFFFGLVLASVYFVSRKIDKWNAVTILVFVAGAAMAASVSLLSPASQNDNIFYVFLCGVVAACSMILPGLSGSFVLILMGNYELVMIEAITQVRFDILLPLVIGAGVGLLGFSYVLSWVFRKFRNQTISGITGFILGSLLILWPWKTELIQEFGEKTKVTGYQWNLPEVNTEMFVAVFFILVGIASIWLMEKAVSKKEVDNGN